MHIELELIIHLYQMDEYGVPRDGDRKEITISALVNFEQPTVITTSANLDGSENRTGNDWRVSIWMGVKYTWILSKYASKYCYLGREFVVQLV